MFCKLFSESFIRTPALLPCAQWPRQAREKLGEQFSKPTVQVILSLSINKSSSPTLGLMSISWIFDSNLSLCHRRRWKGAHEI